MYVCCSGIVIKPILLLIIALHLVELRQPLIVEEMSFALVMFLMRFVDFFFFPCILRNVKEEMWSFSALGLGNKIVQPAVCMQKWGTESNKVFLVLALRTLL